MVDREVVRRGDFLSEYSTPVQRCTVHRCALGPASGAVRCGAVVRRSHAMIAIGLALLLGVVVFCGLWWCGSLEHLPNNDEEPPQRGPPAHPGIGRINALSESELQEQQVRRSAVRQRCEPAADVLAKHADAAETDARIETLQEALGVLQIVVNENEADGAIGVVASTELCNVLIAADVLKALEKLQQDADPLIAARSNAIFQNVIPRIWSF